ncbi:MAG: cytochrome C oxidase subunit IV family protein [Bacteroidota bacterium]|nr:cytochrome C oxidase subunit IV family protein [Bacteroidota bacterium]MDE2646001.1 cytochrome C oxidase subunit IV family protein [Bacteroidota bacterium]
MDIPVPYDLFDLADKRVEMAEEMTMEDIRRHVKVYLVVFASLAVLTVVTVLVSYLSIPFVPALLIALVIATVKASLVALYFMHLVSEKQVVLWVLLVSGIFLIAMFALFIGAHADQEALAMVAKLLLPEYVA